VRPTLALAGRVQRDQLGVEAGSLTYGAFLSLPPMLLLLISVAGVIFQQRADTAQQELIDAVGDIVPGFDQVVATQLQLSRASQVSTGVVGVIGIVYAASGFVARLRHSLGVVFRTRITGLVVGRASGAVLGVPVLFLLVAFTAAAALVAGLEVDGLIGALAEVAGLAVLAAFGAVIWSLVYRLLTPSPGPTVREHLVGAAIFSVGFLLLERFGASYVAGVIARSTALYGTIGAFFGLLAFIYVAMWLFLLAAEITQLRRAPESPITSADA
jgi:YihY family inner membrane protein